MLFLHINNRIVLPSRPAYTTNNHWKNLYPKLSDMSEKICKSTFRVSEQTNHRSKEMFGISQKLCPDTLITSEGQPFYIPYTFPYHLQNILFKSFQQMCIGENKMLRSSFCNVYIMFALKKKS